MPSSKIISVFILCIAIVFSVWLFSNSNPATNTISQKIEDVEVVTPRPYIETAGNDDWKKLLTKIDPKDQVFTDLTSKSKDGSYDDTTVTSQLAKDFLSQYLLAKKGGGDLKPEEMANIVNNIASSPQYSKTLGATYMTKNLRIAKENNEQTRKKYKDTVNLILKNRSSQIKDNPASIMNQAMKSQNEKTLERLDPIIFTAKGFIDDYLNVEVPEGALNIHIAMINSVSNLLSDLEAMRSYVKDPIKSLSAFGLYEKHVKDFQTALNATNQMILRY